MDLDDRQPQKLHVPSILFTIEHVLMSLNAANVPPRCWYSGELGQLCVQP